MLEPDEGVFRMRLLPSAPSVRMLLQAHLEAYDHLAIASDLPDGSVEIVGPATREREIRDVASGIARALGVLTVASVPER